MVREAIISGASAYGFFCLGQGRGPGMDILNLLHPLTGLPRSCQGQQLSRAFQERFTRAHGINQALGLGPLGIDGLSSQ